VHFPVDSASGAILGCQIGEAIAALCGQGPGKGGISVKRFSPHEDFDERQDFSRQWLAETLESRDIGKKIDRSDILSHLWDKAEGEWKRAKVKPLKGMA
jgi:hypothetical protein